jgi:hypothetical protein
MIHRVIIKQVFRTNREMIVEVEADTIAEAVAKTEQECEDGAPGFTDPRWVSHESLENEEVLSA